MRRIATLGAAGAVALLIVGSVASTGGTRTHPRLGPATNTVTAAGSTAGRALADRFAEVANVKDYGAKGDGSTDDTAAFTASLSALTTAQGGTLKIPAGTYKTNVTVATSNITIRGVGAGTDVLASRGATVLIPADKTKPVIQLGDGTSDVRGLSVQNISVWGDTTSATSDCVRVLGVIGATMEHVALIAAGRDGLRIESSATKPSEFIDIGDARILWARGAGVRAIYGAQWVTSVHLANTTIEGYTTGYAVYLDAVQLAAANTWIEAGASHYGLYLKNEGVTLAKFIGGRGVNIDSANSADALVTFDATTAHTLTPWSYVSPEISVDGVAEWLVDATTTDLHAGGYVPTAVWPYVLGRLAFTPQDTTPPTVPTPTWYLYGLDSAGAPALQLHGASLRLEWTYAHPLQSDSPQAALWIDGTAKYLRLRRDGRTASADSNGEIVPVWKASAPATLTDACYVGEIAYDTTRVYVCVATNTWGVASFYTAATHAALDLTSVASGACTAQTTETVAAAMGDSCRVSAGTAIEAGGFTTCAVTNTNEEKWQFCNLSGAPIDRASDTYTVRVLR